MAQNCSGGFYLFLSFVISSLVTFRGTYREKRLQMNTQVADRIIDGGYSSYEYEQELFARHGYKLIMGRGKEERGPFPFEFARNAVGILVRDTPVGPAELDQMPHLKAIVRYGVGYDNIDLKEAKKRGIRIANVQGYANHSVSDHALALMFACTRNLQGNQFRVLRETRKRRSF